MVRHSSEPFDAMMNISRAISSLSIADVELNNQEENEIFDLYVGIDLDIRGRATFDRKMRLCRMQLIERPLNSLAQKQSRFQQNSFPGSNTQRDHLEQIGSTE